MRARDCYEASRPTISTSWPTARVTQREALGMAPSHTLEDRGRLAVTAEDSESAENQEIGHVKLGSTVGGVNQAAGRIFEADGAGDVRWADKGGGSGGSGDALISIDFPTPDATNVYDIIDQLRRGLPEPAGSRRSLSHLGCIR